MYTNEGGKHVHVFMNFKNGAISSDGNS